MCYESTDHCGICGRYSVVVSVGVSTCKKGIQPLLVVCVDVCSVYFLYK